MKLTFKKVHIVLFLFFTAFILPKAYAKNTQIQYTGENISNYFLGLVSASNNFNDIAFEHLNKVQTLKNEHSEFNIKFLRTLVLLEKFKEAVSFSKSVWKQDEMFFEADLLLGLHYFKKKDYAKAKNHFERLNSISQYNLYFEDFIGNILIAWSEAALGNEEKSFTFIAKVPSPYRHLVKVQKAFLQCYFENTESQKFFEELIDSEDFNFSRYNFFLINYLLSKNEAERAKKIIEISRKKSGSNILLKQTEYYILRGEKKKISNFFDFKKPEDSLAEFFYVIANIYSSERDYQLSNFYLRISLFLNKKFLTNKALLAENYYYQKRNKLSQKVYDSLKPIGEIYSWYASKIIARILVDEKGKSHGVKILEKEFKKISNPDFEHYYELANFYKENEYFKESIKYYSLALKDIEEDYSLYPKILDKRGTSYERMGDWKSAEKDLLKSLEIIPDQPFVLNYLAYTWIDMGINLDRGLDMLKKATELRKDDGYIIDSLGWAYYAKKNYIEAEKYLQRAVELLPSDPIVNDHYADALWMLNKNIQARYVWDYVLTLEGAKKELKDTINRKLTFGISKKL